LVVDIVPDEVFHARSPCGVLQYSPGCGVHGDLAVVDNMLDATTELLSQASESFWYQILVVGDREGE
jgi:hypothetical protein